MFVKTNSTVTAVDSKENLRTVRNPSSKVKKPGFKVSKLILSKLSIIIFLVTKENSDEVIDYEFTTI